MVYQCCMDYWLWSMQNRQLLWWGLSGREEGKRISWKSSIWLLKDEWCLNQLGMAFHTEEQETSWEKLIFFYRRFIQNFLTILNYIFPLYLKEFNFSECRETFYKLLKKNMAFEFAGILKKGNVSIVIKKSWFWGVYFVFRHLNTPLLWTMHSSCTEVFIYLFDCTPWLVGYLIPRLGVKPRPRQWMHRVLNTGPPVSSQH